MATSDKNEFSLTIILVIVWLAVVGLIYQFVLSMTEDGYGKDLQRADQQLDAGLAERIKPVMTLDDIRAAVTGSGQAVAATPAPVAAKSAEQLYAGACLACHDSGAAGAPKLGDRAAWESRAALTLESLVATVISGKGAMPPKGGSTYSEQEIAVVVEYMLERAGLLEAEPTPSAQAAPAAAQEPTQPETVAASTPAPVADGIDYLAAGEQAYRGACFACHDSGAAGAPRLGDVAAWAPRMANGFDALVEAAINGKGAMPPKGGAMYLTREEIVNIIAYMLEMSR